MPDPSPFRPPPADTDVHAIAPDGRQVVIRPGQEATAAAAGYQIQSPDEFAAAELEKREGLTGAAKAFGQQGLSAATLGLSDVAGGALGGDDFRRTRALRQLAYPTAGAAGEAAGIVAPALLSGGESLLAKGAAMTPVGVLGSAARGAEELVGSGLGALGVTGESLLGRVALGGAKMAAAGAVEGAGFGAGNALSEAALAPGGDYTGIGQKLWAGAIDGAEFGALTGGALGAGGGLIGGIGQKIGGSKMAREWLQDAADAHTLKSAGSLGSDIAKMSPEQRAANAAFLRSRDEIGFLDSVKDVSGKLKAAKEETGKLLGDMRKKLDEVAEVTERPNLRTVLDKIETRANELTTNVADKADVKLAEELRDRYEPLRKRLDAGDSLSFEETTDVRKKLDEQLKGAYKRLRRGEDVTPLERELMGVRRVMETEFETAAERVMQRTDPEFLAAYQDAKARYGAATDLSKIATKRAGSVAGNRSISLTDTMAGLTGSHALGPLGGMAALAANRAIRSVQADRIVGEIANRLANIDTKVNSSVGKFVTQAKEAAKGSVRRAIGETVHGSDSGGFKGRQERVGAYYRKLAAIQRESESAPGELVHIPGAPKVQQAAEAARRQAISYLLGEAPKPPQSITNPLIARIARQAPPSEMDMQSWNRKVAAVEHPMDMLRLLEQGRLKRDHVDALAATNPALLDQMRKAALDKISDDNRDMSYDARLQLGLLLGVQTDPSLAPEVIAAAQEPYQARRQMQQQAAQDQAQAQQSAQIQRQAQSMASRTSKLETGASI